MTTRENHLVRVDVDSDRTRTNAPKPGPLVNVPLERLDVSMAHLTAEHPHQRRP